MQKTIWNGLVLATLPIYSVVVALDDDTDVRVLGRAGWSVSSRFKGEPRYDTKHLAVHVGVRLVHRPLPR